MPNLVPFAFEDNLVRSCLDENGEPWFVAKDVCRVLGIEIHLRHPCAFHGSGAGTEREGGRISFPPSTQTGLPCASMACRVCRWIAEMSLPCPWSFAVPSHPTPMRLMSAGPRGFAWITEMHRSRPWRLA